MTGQSGASCRRNASAATRMLAAAVVGITGLSTHVMAAATWTGGGTGDNWTLPANWGGTAPVAGDALIFDGATRLTPNNDFAAGTAFSGITFNPTARAFVLNGNSINLGGNIVNNATTGQSLTLGIVMTQNASLSAAAGAMVISSAISGNAGNLTLNLNGSATAVSTISGVISNGGATSLEIVVSGSATWALTGTNTFTGNVTVNGGTLRATDFVGLPTSALLTLNGGVFETDNLSRASGASGGSFQILGGTSGFSANGTAAVNIGSGETLNWGTANFNPGTLVLQAATANQPLNFINALDLKGAVRTIAVNNNSNTNIATISASITDSSGGGGLTKTGTGLLALTASNTYSGPTTVGGGTLRADDGFNLPAGSLLVLNGGALETGAGTFIRPLGSGAGAVQFPGGASGLSATGIPLTVNIGNGNATLAWGDPNFNPGTLTLQAGSANQPLTLANGLDLKGAVRTIAVNNTQATANATLGAAVIDSGGGGGLTKTGAGVLVVPNTSTYTGTTSVTGGVLRADDGTGLPTNSALTLNGGALEVSFDFTSRGLGTTAGQVQLPGGASGFSVNSVIPVNVGIGGGITLKWLAGSTFNPGTLTLQAASANQPLTFANGLDVNGATRTIATNANIANVPGNILDSSTGGGLTKVGNGSLILTGTLSYSGTTTVNGGVLQLGNGTLTSSVSGNIVLTAGTIIFNPGGNLTISGSISGAGAVNIPITTPTASTITLAGNNTYTGNLTISNGTFVINSSTNTGTSNGTLVINASTPTGQAVTLLSVGGAHTIGKALSVGGALANPFGMTVAGDSSLTFNSSSSSFTATAANVYINNNLTGTATLTFSGPFHLSNNTGNRSVRFGGPGVTIINGFVDDSVSNPTTVNSVIIRAPGSTNTNTGITIFNSTSLSYHGGTQISLGTILFNVPGVLPSTTIQGNASTNAFLQVRTGGAVGYAGGITDPAFLAMLSNTSQITNDSTANSFATGALAIASASDATKSINFAAAPATGSSWGSMSLGAANGAYTYTGVLTPLGQNWRLGGGNGSLTFAQPLTDLNGSAANLSVAGGGMGVLILSSSGNNYTGPTTLADFQTLRNGATNALPPTTTLTTAGGTTSTSTSVYDLNGFNQSLSGLSGAGVITSSTGPSTLFMDFGGSGNTFVGTYSGNMGFGLANSYTLTTGFSLSGPSVVPSGALFVLNFTSGSMGTIGGGGATEIAANAIVISNGITTPALTIDDGATLNIRSGQGNLGTSKVSTLSISGTAPAFTGKLDLGDSRLIVQSTGGTDKSSKVTSLLALIKAGSNGGLWNGKGITSSAAAGDAAHVAVGIFDNAALGLSTIGGQSADPNSILVAAAHQGDSNRNGIVDIQDQSIVTNHWQSAQNNWAVGDLNLDGFVDLQDLTLVTNNWQASSPLNLSAPAGGFGVSAVPEPASLAVLTVGGAVLLARRRRK